MVKNAIHFCIVFSQKVIRANITDAKTNYRIIEPPLALRLRVSARKLFKL